MAGPWPKICQQMGLNSKIEKFTPKKKKIAKVVRKNKQGYLLEVDADYHVVVHDRPNELPF